MRAYLYYFSLLLSISFSACQSNAEFDEFDTDTWKSDRSACKGKRESLKDAFEKIRPKLKGLTQIGIMDVLGRPDLQRLDERNMTSYLYFLEPAGTCQTSGRADAKVAIVRFNAVGLAFEIIYEQGTPL